MTKLNRVVRLARSGTPSLWPWACNLGKSGPAFYCPAVPSASWGDAIPRRNQIQRQKQRKVTKAAPLGVTQSGLLALLGEITASHKGKFGPVGLCNPHV